MPLVGSVKSILPAQRSFRLAWPSTMLAKTGEDASSKSAMKTLAPEFSALTIILRSTGPVISTRRSRRSAGILATLQSPSRMDLVSGRKSGNLPASKSSWRPMPPRQQFEPPPVEAPMQPGDERERLGAENFVLPAAGLGVDLDAGYSRVRCHEGLRKGVGRSETHVLDLFSAFVESRPSHQAARSVRSPTEPLAPSPSPDEQARRVGVQRQRRRVVDVGPCEADVAQLVFRHPRQFGHRAPRRADPRRPGQDAPQSLGRLRNSNVNVSTMFASNSKDDSPFGAKLRRWKSFNLGMIISGCFVYSEPH